MREMNYHRAQEMDMLMIKLTELTTAQENRKPPPGLSSSFYHQDSVLSDGSGHQSRSNLKMNIERSAQKKPTQVSPQLLAKLKRSLSKMMVIDRL